MNGPEHPPGVRGILSRGFLLVSRALYYLVGGALVISVLAVMVFLLGVVPVFGIGGLLIGQTLFGVAALALTLPLWLVGLGLPLRHLRGGVVAGIRRSEWWRELAEACALSALFVVTTACGIFLAMFVLGTLVVTVSSLPGEQAMVWSLIAVSLAAAVRWGFRWAGRL